MISPKKSLEQQSNYSQKSSSQFSSVNKFDYPLPIKNLPNTKSPPKPDSIVNQNKQKQNEQTIRKARYYWHMRNEHHNERDKVKQRQENINRKQQQQKKQKIREQLMRKKMQLQKLQLQRQQAIKRHGQAIQNAKKLNHNMDVKRLKSQQNAKQQHFKEQQRFKTALIKAKSQKQLTQFSVNRQNSAKRIQTRNLYKSRQRQAAEQYKMERQAYEREAQEIQRQKSFKQLQEKFVANMKQKTGKNINFQNTCYHSFAQNVIVIDDSKNNMKTKGSSNTQSNDASHKQLQRFYTERKSFQAQQAQQNRQKSIQRGRQALKKLKQAKQYTKYMQQTQQEQINYNRQRIQAGKRNQFIGLKPQTLMSLSRNKQQRAQEEFQDIFVTPQQNNKKSMRFEDSPKGYLGTERTMYSENRTQLTDRTSTSRAKNIASRLSPRNQANDKNYNIRDISDEEQTNIYTLPYNTKIHGIMLEKSRPEYCRKLFQDNKAQLKNKLPMKQDTHDYNEAVPLDYSMTEDQNDYF